jgi:hypothetical protein
MCSCSSTSKTSTSAASMTGPKRKSWAPNRAIGRCPASSHSLHHVVAHLRRRPPFVLEQPRISTRSSWPPRAHGHSRRRCPSAPAGPPHCLMTGFVTSLQRLVAHWRWVSKTWGNWSIWTLMQRLCR